MGLSVEYPITRPFGSRWFAPVTYTLAFLLLVVLVVVNTALAGYETVTVFSDSYNATHPLWFHKFLVTQKPEPGTLCDSKLFNVGDTFTTNYSIFQWQVEYIAVANVASSGFAYKGTPLDGCDVTSIYVDGDMTGWNMDVTGVMTCKPTDGSYEFTARSSYSISALAGNYHPILGVTGVANPRVATSTPRGDVRPLLINAAAQTAALDVADRIEARLTTQASTSPVRLSAALELPWCPQVSAGAACSTKPPTFTIQELDAVYSNTSLVQATNDDLDYRNPLVVDMYPPMANLIQIVYAGFRVDLGISSPNNILTQEGAWKSTLNTTFPATSTLPAVDSKLAHFLSKPSDFGIPSNSIPLSTSGSAEIRVVYPCKFQQRKKTGSAIIAVISATSAMFTAAWGVFIVVAATFAKRAPRSNECLHQCDCIDRSSPDSNRLSRPPMTSRPTSEQKSFVSSV
ncbi:hypothetical protein DL96DRAFT_820177 [Flagelloscypha sp. PMI_526]|nr:hypothetical protein DL96DRAFT_820177 [Flagelloscypha sp. PMI_526]